MSNRAAPVLLLIPTEGEREQLLIDVPTAKSLGCTIEVLGFGVVAAASRATALVAQHHPRRVILAGIAGTFDESRLAIGTAAEFGQVKLCGVGRTTESETTSAAAIGWAHWHPSQGPALGDQLPLQPIHPTASHALLTACAASGDIQTAKRRSDEFECAAEDMEGFSVAFACQQANVPLSIMRGLSNVVGVVDKSKWHVADAMNALSNQIIQTLEGLSS